MAQRDPIHPNRRAPVGLLLAVALLAVALFTAGFDWGLPTRQTDRYLFGHRMPWTGEQILALAPVAQDARRGADVDANPRLAIDGPVLLNGDDASRAEIVRRYRLFTHQPDEASTFMVLAGMRPAELRLDPRLYQYGGLWIYPIGALLKAAALAGWVDLRSDLAYYLDHPDQFGRFYIVGRLYSAAWGMVAVLAVYGLARRLTDSAAAALFAGVLACLMPVAINAAHENKPHMAGAAVTLLAVLAACRFADRPTWGRAMAAAALVGAAGSMVLSAWSCVLLLPAMVLLTPLTRGRRWAMLALTPLAALAVYALCNPYVVKNLLFDRALIFGSMGNTTAMYRIDAAGLLNALLLLSEAASPVLAAVGVAAVVFLAIRRRQGQPTGAAGGLLLAAAVAPMVVVFFLLASGKPAEYARFALPACFALTIAAAALLARMPGVWRVGLGCLLLCTCSLRAAAYVRAYMLDAQRVTTRLVEADGLYRSGIARVALYDDPAPYLVPPVDLWRTQIIKLPRGADPPAGTLLITPRERFTPWLTHAPIAWASKLFDYRRGPSPP